MGIMGLPESGKSTIALALEERGWKIISLADALREGLLAINPYVAQCPKENKLLRLSEIIADIGWDLAKKKYPEVRRLMRAYGSEGGRNIHGNDCWSKIVVRRISELPGGVNVVIPDVRFETEIEVLRKHGVNTWSDVTFIDVERPGTKKSEHDSDALDYLSYSSLGILNDATKEDLRDLAIGLFVENQETDGKP
jgi:hypothetical protein